MENERGTESDNSTEKKLSTSVRTYVGLRTDSVSRRDFMEYLAQRREKKMCDCCKDGDIVYGLEGI